MSKWVNGEGYRNFGDEDRYRNEPHCNWRTSSYYIDSRRGNIKLWIHRKGTRLQNVPEKKMECGGERVSVSHKWRPWHSRDEGLSQARLWTNEPTWLISSCIFQTSSLSSRNAYVWRTLRPLWNTHPSSYPGSRWESSLPFPGWPMLRDLIFLRFDLSFRVLDHVLTSIVHPLAATCQILLDRTATSECEWWLKWRRGMDMG